MKKRNDFVTNSSSSSFIISKNNDINEVEKLYQFLKESYCRWINARNEMIEFCKNSDDFIVSYDENGEVKIKSKYSYKTKEEQKKNRKLDQFLTERFGMDTWSYHNHYTGWMNYGTYVEYLEATKREKYISYDTKPFLIYDFNKYSEEDDDEIRNIIQWYYPCYKEERYSEEELCQYCHHEGTEICKKFKENDKKLPEDFGDLCVFSESGYIPDFVRFELEEHCMLCCNHMG